MAEVIWTRGALRDLHRIFAYIREFRPQAAARMADRIRQAAANLATEEQRGRPIGGGRRELTIIWPYLIRYRLRGSDVIILEVRHGARRPD
ncbi:MAG TPA: type II toxin-antitoxin system RelE/ParE family toxin [Caulobacteraceae bacterium]|nr:type II toxin-antitoxin system RelE/ParE family toxin [Caulobacteraceae bacterium]